MACVALPPRAPQAYRLPGQTLADPLPLVHTRSYPVLRGSLTAAGRLFNVDNARNTAGVACA
jgi:hypothetical protein